MNMELYDLTNPQKSIWLMEQFYKGSTINNLCGTVSISEVIDFTKLNEAINILVRDNDALRIHLNQLKDGTIKQFFTDFSFKEYPLYDLSSPKDLKELESKLVAQKYQVLEGDLNNIVLFRFPDSTGGLIIGLSHLVGDACTASLLANKVTTIYNSLKTGSDNPEKPASYADYILSEEQYLLSQKFEKDRQYWEETFTSVPDVGIIPSLKTPLNENCEANRMLFTFSKQTVDNINEFCRNNRISIFNFLMGIYALYIGRISNLTNFTLGTPVLNRTTFVEKNTPGMFISTVPLQFNLTDNSSFVEFTQNIAKDTLSVFRHQRYPYQNILEHVRKTNPSQPNLYDILISYQNSKTNRNTSEIPYRVNWIFNNNVADSMQIHMFDMNDEGTLNIAYDYKISKYSNIDISNIHNRISSMISQVLANSTILLCDIDIVTDEEKNRILNEFNDTYLEYEKINNIVSLIERIANKSPNKIAIEDDSSSISYRELIIRVHKLANYLLTNNITENQNIGVIASRSIDTIVAILAILKINCTYVPIDPEYPDERINYMIKNSNIEHLLLCSSYNSTKYNLNKIFIDYADYIDMPEELTNTFQYDWNNNLYVIFTSGSTGYPKGVTISHKNMINLINFEIKNTNILANEHSKVLQFATMSFDVSYQEIFSALLSGKTLVLIDDKTRKNITNLSHYIFDKNIDTLFIPPAYLKLLVENEAAVTLLSQKLKNIITAGEPLVITDGLKKLILAGINVHNHYGPAETHVATTYIITKDNIEVHPPIGKPISNAHIYILDKNNKLCPIGVAGQIAISGDCVGNGYFCNISLTQEKFIHNPFFLNEKMYLTGDIGYFDYGGNIHYIGRTDFQVKINGFRIELGEVDQVLLKNVDISSAISVIQEYNNKKYIISYFTSKNTVDTEKLNVYIKQYLPFYMLPKRLVQLTELPLTANGKINRRALPPVDFSALNINDYKASYTNTQKQLVLIFEELFNIPKVSITSNFFDLGGDSLLAIKLCTLVSSKCYASISITDIFTCPTLEKLANLIDSSSLKNSISISKYPEELDSYPLSSAQKRIYYATKSISESNVVYNIPSAFVIDSVLDITKVHSAFKKLLKIHSSLRTCFRIINGEPRQVVLKRASIGITELNVQESEIQNIIADFPRPFDLETAPLLRVNLYHLDTGKTLLMLDSHHIIMDGVSLNNLMNEFCKLYQGEEISAPLLEYTDYTMWEKNYLNSDLSSASKDFWNSQLKSSELPIINLPYDKPISKNRLFDGKIIFKNISPDIFFKLELLAKKYDTSSYMVFLAAFYVLLYDYTSQDQLLIGTPVSGRTISGLDDLIGMFVNILPLKVNINKNLSFTDFLMKIKDFVIKCLENQLYPYDQILKDCNISSASSFMDVVFTYQNIVNSLYIREKQLQMIYSNTNTAKYNLSVGVIPNTSTFYIEYNSNLFYPETINNILEHYIFILNKILENPNIKINTIPKTTPYEETCINKFNNTVVPLTQRSIASIFEHQVELTPDKIALVCNGKYLTYSELNKKANSLAHLLITNHIGANDIICIMTNRSLETVICMLAILKAGAAFFNVDPTYPIERTKYYIENSKTKYVLTQRALKYKVTEIENSIEIDLDNILYNQNFNNPNVSISDNDLSYLIFTSGSTGKPKGVMLNQIGFANMVQAMTPVLDYLGDGKDHTLASVTSTPFDIFVYEIFVSLTHGLKVIMANNAEHRNPKLLDSLIRTYNVDVMTVTPSLMKINYDNREEDSALALVKNMVFGGEPLPESFIKDLKSLANDITIYNIYGPSEITVLSNVQNLEGEKDISVGPPIMNTQIYILDSNMKQVPLGVTGEIYIGGIQVGLGYIGNPELTKERFIDNPFGPGKIYKSGDIGRWTFDGKIQCLGRIDNQVKLRGLRIELGEIENQISLVPGVTSAVVSKVSINNKESLCGYYVSEIPVNENTVKEHLRRTLPPYMVPTYIVHLDTMPYTLNRKIDRKALPMPNAVPSKDKNISTTNKAHIDISSLDSDEQKLLQIWKNILNLDNLSIDDNFFDIGGDSVSAISMQIEALKYGLNFEYADIFNHPTIRELCTNITSPIVAFNNEKTYSTIEKVLKLNTIENINTIKDFNVGNILLIGSTGFLGIHIMNAFLKQETGDIYCLIRKKDNIDPIIRLKQKIEFYFGNDYYEKYASRIHVIQGNIIDENLSLSSSDIELLKDNISTIINSGAIVKHFGQSDLFEAINVKGTENIINLSKYLGVRLLHISTISVSGNGEKEETIIENEENIKSKKMFTERSLFINQNIKGIYAITKYKAECLVLKAISEGLNAQILRIGNITSRYSDGLFQENVDENAFAKKIKSFIEIGAFPDYLLKHSLELTPVDLCANAILHILQHDSICTVLHVYDTKLMPVKLLAETLEKCNIKLYPVSDQLLSDIITGILDDDTRKSCLSGIIHDLDKNKHLVYTSNIKLNCDFSEQYLEKIDFKWLDINEDYLLKYIHYLNKIGFIKNKEI